MLKAEKQPEIIRSPMKIERPTRMGFLELRETFLKKRWSFLSWGSGFIAMSFILYYGVQARTNPQIGAQFVLDEWPPTSISPYFYAKPITWFVMFSFMYWAFGLESNRERFLRLSPRTRRFMFIITATVAFGSFYEIFFNFMLWSALLVVTTDCGIPCNPDLLANIYPVLRNPINLVFATKVVTTVFALSIYSLWYLHRLDRDLELERSSPGLR